jgi:Uri superfamily endonuclease
MDFSKNEKGHYSVDYILCTAAVSALVLAATAFVAGQGEKLQSILKIINRALR